MSEPTDTLCLQCGLCCNGVLFADVRRERGDNSPLFAQFGSRVAQPCPAFNSGNCQCAIYAERPSRCRKFECRQLLAVRAGKKTSKAVLKTIFQARALLRKVEELLERLGFNETSLPFDKRFQKCQRAAEQGKVGDLDCLSDLQLAVHQLNQLLERNFYA